MSKQFFTKVFIGIFLFTVLVPSFAVAEETGNHFGERKNLSYSIEYLDPLGVTEVDETGITYRPYTCCESYENTVLPERYFGSYTLYFGGGVLHFQVIINNDSYRTYRNIKVEAFQEYLNVDGNEGEALGSDNQNTWFIEKLGPYEEIILSGEFHIPLVGESGIDQTHLRISHWSIADRESDEKSTKGEVILEDFQAGLWCPKRLTF